MIASALIVIEYAACITRIQKGFHYKILLCFHFNSFLRKANHPTQDKMIVNPTEYIG